MPEFQPNRGEEVVCVFFCSPSAETIHQELGAHYTLKNTQKENENSVSKILCADSQRIVIKALRFALVKTTLSKTAGKYLNIRIGFCIFC
ncbi:hypothetical protein M8013_21440 [Enterobacteriaceae bacterium H4N4]|uniref:Uncharacterized protein n=1 Tax=Silvania confinis TaxID=2926470 RepID=A0A9J6QSL2_9ENTR|nr:hypothetical protein [Silvania confinis]MCU6671293.1 hypothetical protein [Silvania confinis]